MKTFIYDKKPNISELWDDCIYNLIYDTEKYVSEIEYLFKDLGINKKSKIIDVSVGSGFPVLELTKKGYFIDCMDISEDAIKVFDKKAKKFGVKLKCKKLSWLEMPKYYKKENYDFLFCRGNSFIYASGGWDSEVKLDRKIALENYEKTLKIFYDSMKPGGWFYIDKFKDNEKNCKELVGQVKIKNKLYDWYLYRNTIEKIKKREAKMLLVDKSGEEIPLVDFTTYLLTFKELIQLMKKVGFKDIKKENFKSEVDFDILIAKK